MMPAKTALVTGGNQGIGLEVCRQLASLRYQVFLAARDRNKGLEAASALTADGLRVESVRLDVDDEGSIREAAAALAARTPHLDALVNNAGVLLDEPGQGISVPAGDVMASFRTNALGPLLVTRAFLPLLEKSPSPQVVNVSSGLGQLESLRFSKDHVAYRVSKSALNALTMILASELAPRRVSVNAVCPGWVRTRMGGVGAERPVAKGAETIVWAATGGADDSGGFYRDKQRIEW